MLATVRAGNKSVNLQASVLLKTGTGYLTGIFVSAASATPTIKLWDSLSATGTVLVGTFTPTAGQWHATPFAFYTGLYITISGTVDCTPSFE